MRLNRLDNSVADSDFSVLPNLLDELAKKVVSSVTQNIVDTIEEKCDYSRDPMYNHLYYDDDTIDVEAEYVDKDVKSIPIKYEVIKKGMEKMKEKYTKAPVIICNTGKKGVEKLLEVFKGKKVEIILASHVLKQHDFKLKHKHGVIYNGDVLVPSYKVLNSYYTKGYGDEYIKDYIKYLAKPDIAYDLNTMMLEFAFTYDIAALIFVCGNEEAEFEYLKILKKRIKSIYDIDVVSSKKYLKNKKNLNYGEKKWERIRSIANSMDYELECKLHDAGYFK